MRFSLIVISCCLLMCLWPCVVRPEESTEYPCQGYFEEGKHYWWNCYARNFEDTMGWQLKQNGQYVNISTCNIQGTCTDYMSPYKSKLIVGEDGGRKYTMKVRIKANKEESTFRCFYDSTLRRDVCNEIFVRPSPPVCDPPTLENSDTQISIRCTTDRVYPSALLEITNQQEGLPDGPTADTQCKTYPSVPHPGYMRTQCTALFPLSGLKPNIYQFNVAMYPNISDMSVAMEKRVESDQPYYMILKSSDDVQHDDDGDDKLVLIIGISAAAAVVIAVLLVVIIILYNKRMKTSSAAPKHVQAYVYQNSPDQELDDYITPASDPPVYNIIL